MKQAIYHEASHAVAAVALGIRFHSVNVHPDDDNLGGMIFLHKRPFLPPGLDPTNSNYREYVENLMVVVFAGEAGDAFNKERDFDITRPEARGDLEIAKELFDLLSSNSDERVALFKEVVRRACCFVREPLRERQISSVAHWLDMARDVSEEQVIERMNVVAPDASFGDLEGQDQPGE